MTFFASLLSYVIGLPLGILLYSTSKGRILSNRPLNLVLGLIVNICRSLPFLILLVLLIPFTRFVTGSSMLEDGAVVAVPNNVTNEARALLLLAQEGIISLKEEAGVNATVEDITDNPKNIEFKELAPEQLVSALPDVDIAVINGNYAIEGGLHVSQALAVEANDGIAAVTYGNIIATSPDKADDESLKTLVEVLQSDEISSFIRDKYDGAVVPLN